VFFFCVVACGGGVVFVVCFVLGVWVWFFLFGGGGCGGFWGLLCWGGGGWGAGGFWGGGVVFFFFFRGGVGVGFWWGGGGGRVGGGGGWPLRRVSPAAASPCRPRYRRGCPCFARTKRSRNGIAAAKPALDWLPGLPATCFVPAPHQKSATRELRAGRLTTLGMATNFLFLDLELHRAKCFQRGWCPVL